MQILLSCHLSLPIFFWVSKVKQGKCVGECFTKSHAKPLCKKNVQPKGAVVGTASQVVSVALSLASSAEVAKAYVIEGMNWELLNPIFFLGF